jgi:hypothetical protein
MRLPLGVHRLTGERYPFVALVDGQVVPLVSSVSDALTWFSTVERVPVAALPMVEQPAPVEEQRQKKISFKEERNSASQRAPTLTIRDWCLAHDPLLVIGRYVELDANGLGCCPFGGHHAHGVDRHPSLVVYRPVPPEVMCWYCHTLGGGGSLFDFFRLYYGLDARELWHRILSGGQF